jgi:hypothetical protein
MMVLFVMLVGGLVSCVIAAAKNRSGLGWFLIGALFPLLGLILVLVLPKNTPIDDMAVPEPEPGPWQLQQQQLSAARATQNQALDALARLAELKQRGALDDQEYQAKKAALLASV